MAVNAGIFYGIQGETMMMKIILLSAIILSIAAFGYCADANIGELVDQYKHATDLQRQELEKNFIGKSISAGGTVENVGQYDFFDISNDTGGKYYKILLQQQETANKVPYQVVFLYKDKDSVRDINRGQAMEKEGNVVKIVDERLQIAVWIYNGELTDRERQLFK
jgi:hypothetical protein